MKVSEETWKLMKDHLGYGEEEMRLFRADRKNEEILAKFPEMMNKTIVFEVVESTGCNTHHKVGDRFYFDAAGNLITKKSPKRVCVYAMNAVAPLIFSVNELIFAGIDPNDMRFKHAGCFDVGVKCGGWGRIVMRCIVEEREK